MTNYEKLRFLSHVAEIARQLGDVSARTVANRIDALTEGGIINVRAIINPKATGYGVLADGNYSPPSQDLRGLHFKNLGGLPCQKEEVNAYR